MLRLTQQSLALVPLDPILCEEASDEGPKQTRSSLHARHLLFACQCVIDPGRSVLCVLLILKEKCVHPAGDADGDVTGISLGHFRLSLCRIRLDPHTPR